MTEEQQAEATDRIAEIDRMFENDWVGLVDGDVRQ